MSHRNIDVMLSQPTPAIGIGSTVWVFDYNHRVYAERKPGEKFARGGPIWRQHWLPRVIVGETARSWVTSHGTKIPKTGARPDAFAFSEEEINRRAWVHDNRHRIAAVISACQDHDTLRAVAAAIGYGETT